MTIPEHTIYGPQSIRPRDIGSGQHFPLEAKTPDGGILDKARTRLWWIEKELGRVDDLRKEAEQLRRMIAAGEIAAGTAEEAK